MNKTSLDYLPSLDILKSLVLFQGIDQNIIEDVLEDSTYVALPKKSIISSDDTNKYFFVIIGGKVKISQINPDTGREYTIFILEKGDVFDIISLLDGKEHKVIIEAIDDLRLLRASVDNAKNWLNKHPQFNKNFFPYLGNKMKLLESAASDMALYDTMTRLARLILRYVDNKNPQNQKYPIKLIQDFSHEALAEMIGTVRKVININIQKMKKDGILGCKKGELFVEDLKKLLEKANIDI